MRWTVLVDNSTTIDRFFRAEPGLSFLVEDKGTRVLSDSGNSGMFLRNAQELRLSLAPLDRVAVPRGQLDHTRGSDPRIKYWHQVQDRPVQGREPPGDRRRTGLGLELNPENGVAALYLMLISSTSKTSMPYGSLSPR